jgi:RNA polymerase sigma-70 factor, ECF subfamily
MDTSMTKPALATAEAMPDEQIVEQVLGGATAMFEIIMRRYNQRLYRVAYSILRDANEAEDVVQDAYVRAYQHLNQFAGRAKFSTWLTRIAVHESLARVRRNGRYTDLEEDVMPDVDAAYFAPAPDPEQLAWQAQVRALLESAIKALPAQYRTVVMMRDVEGMSTAEAAECLDITEENAKVRLHRARAMLRDELWSQVGASGVNAFAFNGAQCDRIVHRVFERIEQLECSFDRPATH